MLPFCLGDATILNEVCICVNRKYTQVIKSLYKNETQYIAMRLNPTLGLLGLKLGALKHSLP